MNQKKILIAMMIMAIAILAVACTVEQNNPKTSGTQPPTSDNVGTNTAFAGNTGTDVLGSGVPTQEFKKFESIEELQKFLALANSGGSSIDNNVYGPVMMESDMMVKSAPSGAPMAAAGNAGGMIAARESATDYSETNIQVAGVDEADFVKNDDRYIYMIADNKFIIVDAYNAKNADIISTTKINVKSSEYSGDPQARELFVNKDSALLFVQYYEPDFYFQKYDVQPMPSSRAVTIAIEYDISDRAHPREKEQFKLSGNYFESRMIKDKVYVITQEGVRGSYVINEPYVRFATTTVKPSIYYFDNPEQNYQFNTVTSIDLTNKKVVDTKTFMLGYSNTVMMSEDNLYIAYQKGNYWGWWCYRCGQYDKERFDKIILPKLPSELKDKISTINKKSGNEEQKWSEISIALASYLETNENKYQNMMEDIADALEEYDTKKALEDKKTIIQKIAVDDGKIEYIAKGEIPGSLLNQYSMDEFKGNLRVASTVDIWNKKRIQYNNVYVLDAKMNTVGMVEGIAPDERIYSTRFVGSKLYMVTFRQVDPFFVIDLSSPQNPKVAGKLKLPGYSDYLHPYDDTHIIGIGKETKENEYGNVVTQGLKIALFDVSNMENPKLIDKMEIGDQGSDSAALHDPHAFLFSKEKNLLVLPVTEVTQRSKIDLYRWSNSVWNGAYVIHVDAKGFSTLGKVRHSSTKTDYFDWWNEATVLRSIYLDDNLYTISNKYIKINDLGNDLEDLNTVDLPNTGRWYWR